MALVFIIQNSISLFYIAFRFSHLIDKNHLESVCVGKTFLRKVKIYKLATSFIALCVIKDLIRDYCKNGW